MHVSAEETAADSSQVQSLMDNAKLKGGLRDALQKRAIEGKIKDSEKIAVIIEVAEENDVSSIESSANVVGSSEIRKFRKGKLIAVKIPLNKLNKIAS